MGWHVLANSGAPQQLCSGRGLPHPGGRGGGMGSGQDAITELEQGHVLTASTATSGNRPWDSEASDKAHLSYFTTGSSYFSFSLQFSLKGMVVNPFPKERKTNCTVFQGFVRFLWGTIAVFVSMVNTFCLSLFSSSPSPSRSLHLYSFSFIVKVTKGIDGRCRDFGNTEGYKGEKKNHMKIRCPKRSTVKTLIIVLLSLFSLHLCVA